MCTSFFLAFLWLCRQPDFSLALPHIFGEQVAGQVESGRPGPSSSARAAHRDLRQPAARRRWTGYRCRALDARGPSLRRASGRHRRRADVFRRQVSRELRRATARRVTALLARVPRTACDTATAGSKRLSWMRRAGRSAAGPSGRFVPVDGTAPTRPRRARSVGPHRRVACRSSTRPATTS